MRPIRNDVTKNSEHLNNLTKYLSNLGSEAHQFPKAGAEEVSVAPQAAARKGEDAAICWNTLMDGTPVLPVGPMWWSVGNALQPQQPNDRWWIGEVLAGDLFEQVAHWRGHHQLSV